ncbi:MAG: DUF2125 domain-containing protein [Rhodobacteraceae bacterium]|nr:DUF2125 domain-containing protein [Paracoccaceae bacterium]
MSHYLARGCGAAIVYAFAAQGALADLTAEDVWTEWRAYLTGVGYEISGNESRTGSGLTVTDVSMSMQLPENSGMFSVGMPELEFRENGDGTVSVVMPARVPMRFEATDGEEQVNGEIGLGQTDASLVVSGSPADMIYTYSAAQMRIALDSLMVDGQTVPPEIGHVSMDLGNVASTTRVKQGGMRDYSQTMQADQVTYDVAFKDPDSAESAKIKGAIQGLSFEGTGRIPMQLDTGDLQKMMADGFAFDGRFAYASGSSSMAVQGTGDDFSYEGSSQGGSLGMAMDASHLAYALSQTGTSVNIANAELPFPVSFQLQEVGFSIDMPVAKSDEQQPFAFGMTMAGFTMPDMLWGIFDPGAILPRDPATIALDLTGKVKVLFDLLDPESAAMMEDQPPGELHALTIRNLLVSAVGASLSGTGDFTFDNSDLQSFDGMPKPAGKADLTLVGANGLIDKLIQMGFVSDQDAMGARMMMGMLAVPGDAPDTLNSTIEINEQGHIMANGQRIK